MSSVAHTGQCHQAASSASLQRGDRVRRRSGGPEGTIEEIYTRGWWRGPVPPSRYLARVQWLGNVRYLSGRRDQSSTLLLSSLQPADAPVRHRQWRVLGTWVEFTRVDGYSRLHAYAAYGRRHRTLCGLMVEQPDRLQSGSDLSTVNCQACRRRLAVGGAADAQP